MPFRIERNDITKIKVDAIVNAANNSLLGGGGVDGAIHAAAGPKLLEECRTLGGCETGDAKLTKGYNLPAKYVIHTVGPVWHGGNNGEEELLRSCYRRCLEIANENSFESIAFPLISAGVYGYPKKEAFKIAVDEIRSFLRNHDMEIILVVFDRNSLFIGDERFREVQGFIDAFYVEIPRRVYSCAANEPIGAAGREAPAKKTAKPHKKQKRGLFSRKESRDYGKEEDSIDDFLPSDDLSEESVPLPCAAMPTFTVDESFSEMLLRLIDEKGLKDSECYFRANVDRKLFSKIRCNKDYRPSKETAIAFAIALELDLNTAGELLSKAGYTLSNSILFDVIIRYFFETGNYNIFEINEVLFSFDLKCL